MSPMLGRVLKALLPPLVLGIAATGAYVMYLNRPPVETQTPVVAPPAVRVQQVAFESVDLTVSSQGTVQPRTSSQLVPEIAGTVLSVSPAFAVGGFFEEGDVLLEIDPYDYQQALIAAQAQLAQARLRLAQEEAEAEVARREWEELGRGDAGALTLREPQVEDAQAAVASAEAAIDRARRDMERAELRAPYAGRVQSKDVDVGQFVNRGTPVGRIYAVDSAEVRLPLPDEELAYVDVPMSYRGTRQQTGPAVTLSADFAGRRYSWEGRIVRTEGEIDPVSRMVHVVAEVDDPYAPGDDPSRPPLAVGMFVEAEIAGRRVDDVVVLPWAALNGRDRVLIVDDVGRLRYRQVEILRSTTEYVLVSNGLAEGERVSVSALDAVIDGMAVQIAGDGPTMLALADAPAGRGAEAPADAPAADRGAETPPAAAPGDDAAAGAAGRARDRGAETGAAGPARVGGAETGAADPPAEASPGAGRGAAPAGGGGAPGPGRAPAREAPQPERPPVGGARAPAPPRAGELEIDPTLTREEQIAVIRQHIEALRNGTEPPAAPVRRAGGRPASAAAGAGNRMAGARPERSRLAAGRGPEDADAGNATAPADPIAALRQERPGWPETRTTRADAPGTRADAPGTRADAPGTRADAPGTARADARPGAEARLRPGGPGRPSARPDAPSPGGRPARGDAPPPAPAARPVRADTPAAAEVPAPVVALLPFRNVSRNPADDVIGEEMRTVLRIALERAAGMDVVLLAPGDESNAIQRAMASRATWLAGGGYQRVGEQLRVTGRVVDVATGDLLGSVRVDGTVAGRDALTSRLIAALRAELADHAPAPAAPRMADAPAPRMAAPPARERAGDAVAGRPGPSPPAPDPSARRPGPRAVRIAVSPFANISRNPADDAIGATIATAVTGRLGGFPGVALVPLDTAGADGPAALSVASARGADWLVTGGYQHVGGHLRLTARLLQVSDGSFVESVKVDGALDGLSDMLAEAISTLGAAVAANAAGS